VTRLRELLGAATRLVPGLLVLLLGGCAMLRQDVPRPPSRTHDRPQATALGRAVLAAAAERRASAFVLLEDGPSAFMARVALADRAEHSIDVQYYIYDSDAAGSVLMLHLLRAAERGVRVRILLDDNRLGWKERALAELDAHPNVELRVFNPTRARVSWARVLEFVTRMSRLNRRMHNKIFAVDGAAAIVGGRNVGDHYFAAGGREAFRDYDALMLGPAASEAGASFDAFWNSEHAVPAEALLPRALPPSRASRRLAKLEAQVARTVPDLAARAARGQALLDGWLAGRGVHWAQGTVFGERPERVKGARAERVIATRLAELVQGAQHEVLIESAYFVPGDQGVALLADVARRGVRVRVLTNSLAATDVTAVHAGYTRYREALIEAGVELHEFRVRPRARRWGLRHETAYETALHSKVLVVDQRHAWIGSFNMDPRSIALNTEVGVLVDDPGFATVLAGFIGSDLAPEHAWRVTLEPDRDGTPGLVWRGAPRGTPIETRHEPAADLWARFKLGLIRLIPGFEENL
jgi:putative cardiolipin synthase